MEKDEMKVLLVDDEKPIRDILIPFLKDLRYEVGQRPRRWVRG